MPQSPLDLSAFNPNADALITALCLLVDNATLQHIANADYGYESEINYAKLVEIRNTGKVETPLPWPPLEVLNLTRWSEPSAADRTRRQNEWIGAKGHLARAFCCTVLCRAYCDAASRDYLDSNNETLVQLLESMDALEPDLTAAALSSFSWLYQHLLLQDDNLEEAAFLGVAIIYLAMQVDPQKHADVVAALANQIVDCEQAVYDFWGHGVGKFDKTWLVRTTHHQICATKWIALGGKLSDLNAEAKIMEVDVIAGLLQS